MDLPPVDECNIAFPENGRLLPIGKVSHYSEKLVVIGSLEGTPPVNKGTVLWSEDRRALVMVFEIFGPVKKPYYSVRVNSQDHGHTLGLSPGAVLYVVPASLELTHYVFTRELVNQKGSDASWKDDTEVPTELQDYSDDEMEQRVAGKKHGKGGRSRGGRPAPSVTRHSPTVSGSAIQPHSIGGGRSLQPVRPHPWHAHRPAQPQASGMHAGFPHPPYPTHVQQPPVNYPPRELHTPSLEECHISCNLLCTSRATLCYIYLPLAWDLLQIMRSAQTTFTSSGSKVDCMHLHTCIYMDSEYLPSIVWWCCAMVTIECCWNSDDNSICKEICMRNYTN